MAHCKLYLVNLDLLDGVLDLFIGCHHVFIVTCTSPWRRRLGLGGSSGHRLHGRHSRHSGHLWLVSWLLWLVCWLLGLVSWHGGLLWLHVRKRRGWLHGGWIEGIWIWLLRLIHRRLHWRLHRRLLWHVSWCVSSTTHTSCVRINHRCYLYTIRLGLLSRCDWCRRNVEATQTGDASIIHCSNLWSRLSWLFFLKWIAAFRLLSSFQCLHDCASFVSTVLLFLLPVLGHGSIEQIK